MTSYIYDMVDTWNAGATTFTAVKMNVTDTASAAASLLMDLQVGGSSRFRVTKDGGLQIFTTSNGLTQLTTRFGFSYFGGGSVGDTTSSAFTIDATNTRFKGRSNAEIGWANSGTDGNATLDTILTRRAAANLRLGAADVGATTSTVTITIAAPGVVTWTGHTLSTGTPVVFTTTGALPTGITAGTTYYAVVVDANTFQIASSVANAIATPATVITTSGTQSGTHTGTRYNITQRLGMQSVTGVTDRLGADLLIQGSQGTGTGAGGSIIFQVAPAGSSGTAQNALVNAFRIVSTSENTTTFEFWQPAIGGVPARTVELIACNNTGGRIGGIISNASSGEVRFGAFNAGGCFPTFYSNNVERWRIDANGHFLAGADNQYDIGASGASRPRNVYVAGNIGPETSKGINFATNTVYITPSGGTNEYVFLANEFSFGWVAGGARIVSLAAQSGNTNRNSNILRIDASNGTGTGTAGALVIRSAPVGSSGTASHVLEEAVRVAVPSTGVSLLSFSGTTSSFPALKRSSTTLQARLADDSAFASVQGKLTTDTAYTAGDPTTTGYLVVYDSAGVAYKIPAVAV